MNPASTESREFEVSPWDGWTVLVLHLAAFASLWFMRGSVIVAAFTGAIGFLALFGYFTLQPNVAQVLLLFGVYKGTVRKSGFHWVNPFYSTQLRVSLRAHNLNTQTLKVNDKRGNPIEIGAVVVWRVKDTAQASFDVQDYGDYVTIQCESALRHLANIYPYDQTEEHEVTLRGGALEVSQNLKNELQERLEKAGILIEEARISHLAYAPEIAQAMLRRQQAEAIIAARQKIVQGAVGMVEMALQTLSERKIVNLSEDKKAALVSNLLVVLCGEGEVTPIVNTDSRHT